jgi:hypothetical protein
VKVLGDSKLWLLCCAVLCCRLGHNTAHFNVGNYRRLQKEANEVQDAAFFDSHNQVRPALLCFFVCVRCAAAFQMFT